MANQFETSFIPQQPILKVEGVSHRKEVVNFALILSVIVFFAAGVIATGLYFYREQVTARIHQAQKDLADAERYFSIEEINKYQHAATRLRAAKTIIQEHTISSVILDFLESSTAVNVGLTSFGGLKDATGYHVRLTAQAPSYSAVYFQVEQWRSMQPTVQGIKMGGMGLDDDTGIVTFDVSIDIDPSYLEFPRVLERNGSLSSVKQKVEAIVIDDEVEANTQSTTSPL